MGLLTRGRVSAATSTFDSRRPPKAVRAANAAGRVLRVLGRDVPSLEESRLLGAARRRTGLHDFGTDEFREPLIVLLDSLEREARLTPLGRYFARGQIESSLENRLRLRADLSDHPGIAREEIRRPLYVVGLPRTGTTILQNLLALDPANRSLMQWEAARPSPPPERATYETDPRIAAAGKTTRLLDYLAPDARSLHPVGPRMPTECVTLFANSFASLEIPTIHEVPTYLRWCLDADMGPHYGYYRSQLQHLQWRCPGERWLLKSPAHLFWLDVLLDTFPDACIVQTHRDPLQAVGSYCSLAAVLHSIGSDEVDLHAIGEAWSAAWAEGLARAAAAREKAPASFFDSHYDEFLTDPPAAVRRIYEHFDLPFPDGFEDRMRRYLDQNPQHSAGVHRYSLDQFGLDPASEGERFEDYRRRYGVSEEPLR